MIKDRQRIEVEDGDAPEFIGIVNAIMETLISNYSIKEIVFVKIKNWFDHKWLNYSGKRVVPFETGGVKGVNEAAVQNVWRDKVSIPPFNPNRVIYSNFIMMEETENKNLKYRIHKFRRSNDNIHNRIKDYTSDGLVLWFSSNTLTNKRGSLMAYRVQNDQVDTWYATIENKNGWKITKTKGITLNELKSYAE